MTSRFFPRSPQDDPQGWHYADRVGAIASFLCALHCALLPFVLTLLPLVGLQFLADHRFERGFVLFAAALALVALGRGFRQHRRLLPLALALPGLALLLGGVLLAEQWLVLHSVLVTAGGLLLALAHWFNLHHDHANGKVCARSLGVSA